MYDFVIVTHIPAFYKVNLYNELAKKLNILVIFVANNTSEKRAEDFTKLENAQFEYHTLFDGNFQDRKILDNIQKLNLILKKLSYQKLIVSGWDLKEFWYLVMTHRQSKNCLALESTILESKVNGITGYIKKLFLSRLSTVYASGKLHVELLNALAFSRNIKVTKGVGIINKSSFVPIQTSKQDIEKRAYRKKFLYIGRLSAVKNLSTLIDIFNTLSDYTLTIIGEGEQKQELKNKAGKNIIFIDSVANNLLHKNFLENDVFILPSTSEPWGLVVEEALYFGLPVLVSQNCGSSELIENDVNGFVFDPFDRDNITKNILAINQGRYRKWLVNVAKFSLDSKDEIQIKSYLS